MEKIAVKKTTHAMIEDSLSDSSVDYLLVESSLEGSSWVRMNCVEKKLKTTLDDHSIKWKKLRTARKNHLILGRFGAGLEFIRINFIQIHGSWFISFDS